MTLTPLAQLANDLRRNPGGADDYPWEFAKSIADSIDAALKSYSQAEKATAAPQVYRASPGRFTADRWIVETEFMCINGLRAWFEIAVVHELDEAETGYSDGAIGSAEDRAKQIANALNSALTAQPANSGQQSPPKHNDMRRNAEVVAAVQEAIMRHPFWKPGLGSSGFAFGLANTAIDAYTAALSREECCTCGGNPDQPASHHDISCPAGLDPRGERS